MAKRLYIGHKGNGFSIFDITNPTAPVLISSTLPLNGETFDSIEMTSNHLISLGLVSALSPNNTTLGYHVDTANEPLPVFDYNRSGGIFNDGQSYLFTHPNNNVYFHRLEGDSSEGTDDEFWGTYQVIANPFSLTQIKTKSYTRPSAAHGNRYFSQLLGHLYYTETQATGSLAKVFYIDHQNSAIPLDPVIIQRLIGTSFIDWQVDVSGVVLATTNYFFLAFRASSTQSRLFVYDRLSPTQRGDIRINDTFTTSGSGRIQGIYLSGNYIFVFDKTTGGTGIIYAWSITGLPGSLGTRRSVTHGTGWSLNPALTTVEENTLYVARGNGGIDLFDLSPLPGGNPLYLSTISNFGAITGNAWSLRIGDNSTEAVVDKEPPQVTRNIPATTADNQSTHVHLEIDLSDYPLNWPSGVLLSTVVIESALDDEISLTPREDVYKNSNFQNGYTGSVDTTFQNNKGVSFNITPKPTYWPLNKVIRIYINASDLLGNAMPEFSYYFITKATSDFETLVLSPTYTVSIQDIAGIENWNGLSPNFPDQNNPFNASFPRTNRLSKYLAIANSSIDYTISLWDISNFALPILKGFKSAITFNALSEISPFLWQLNNQIFLMP